MSEKCPNALDCSLQVNLVYVDTNEQMAAMKKNIILVRRQSNRLVKSGLQLECHCRQLVAASTNFCSKNNIIIMDGTLRIYSRENQKYF